MFILNNTPIDITRDLTIGVGDDAITYPASSLLSTDLRASLGIVEVNEEPRPDDRFYIVTPNGDGTLKAEQRDLASLRLSVIEEVKRTRQLALDSFPKSSGVSAVYDENVRAVNAYQAGEGDAVTMRDGTTATAYLTRMAQAMNVPVGSFVGYIIAENQAAATKAREIEVEYLRLVYVFIPACNFNQVKVVAKEFSDYCQARTFPPQQ